MVSASAWAGEMKNAYGTLVYRKFCSDCKLYLAFTNCFSVSSIKIHLIVIKYWMKFSDEYA